MFWFLISLVIILQRHFGFTIYVSLKMWILEQKSVICMFNNSWFILASQPEFLICGDQGVLLPPDVESVPFTWEICSLFSGRERRVRVSSLYLLLLKQLQLKIMPLWYFRRWPTLSSRTGKTSLFILTISTAVLKVQSLICTTWELIRNAIPSPSLQTSYFRTLGV